MTLMRAGLFALVGLQAVEGGCQFFFPRHFNDNFPLPGHHWVAMMPPYNEHLIRDVGALNLALLLVLVVAAVTLERTMVRTALAAFLVFAVPHGIFHQFHLEHFPPADAIAQSIILTLVALFPLALLAATFRKRQ